MQPIIPAGGKKMDWGKDLESKTEKTEKTAQNILDDDPQLSAIKDLPGMADGISELEDMSEDVAIDGAPAATDIPVEAVPSTTAPAAGGAVEQAIEKVKDAAQGVADAAVKDVEKAVSDVVKSVGQPAVTTVSDKPEEIKPEEKGEKSEKSETPAEEKKEEKCEEKDEIPGVEGEKDGKVEKEGDKEEKGEKDEKKDEVPVFAAFKGMKRLAELTPQETRELRHYWKDLLGFPGEYVDAMLKKYKA